MGVEPLLGDHNFLEPSVNTLSLASKEQRAPDPRFYLCSGGCRGASKETFEASSLFQIDGGVECVIDVDVAVNFEVCWSRAYMNMHNVVKSQSTSLKSRGGSLPINLHVEMNRSM